MNKATFVKLPALEANDKLREALKKDLITTKQFRDLSGAWLEAKGYIHSDFGWLMQSELDEMGAYKDENGEWQLELEPVSVSRKDSTGKLVHSLEYVPKKAIDFGSKVSQIVRAHKGKPVTPEMAEKILTDWED